MKKQNETLLEDIKMLWVLLKSQRQVVVIIGIVSIFGLAAQAAIPYIYGRLIDAALDISAPMTLLALLIGVWLVLRLFADWTGRYQDRRGAVVSASASNDFEKQLIQRLIMLPVSFHKREKMGKVMRKVTRAGWEVERLSNELAFLTLPSIVLAIFAFSIMALVRWQLALIVGLILIAYIGVTLGRIRQTVKTQKQMMKSWENLYGHAYDTISNIQAVKSAVAEAREDSKIQRLYVRTLDKRRQLANLWASLNARQQAVTSFGFVTVFSTAAWLLRQGSLSTGELVMFIGYLSQVVNPFSRLTAQYQRMREGFVAIKRAQEEILGRQPEATQGKVLCKRPRGEISFKNVSFAYPDKREILKNISFVASPRKQLALVWPSGVGKSTLLDLLGRYLEPTKGQILLDGQDLAAIQPMSLRRWISLVPQEVVLFNDTVLANIAYGKPGSKREAIIKAAKQAMAHSFIKQLPKGYKTLVGERGTQLSVGQKIRISIARAFLRNPAIIILDEPTANLDAATERVLAKSLHRLTKDRTTFIVAHRLSTVSRADQIIVLNKGRIREIGTHQELIKKDGLYASYWKAQILPEEKKDVG